MKKILFLMALLLPMGVWADDEAVIAERNWTGPSWFNDEGTQATCGMTAEGVTITNPEVQSQYWTPQMCVVDGITLQEGHNYKVLITAKVPSGGQLYVQLGSWEDDAESNIYYDQMAEFEVSSEFQDIEILFDGFPAFTKKGHVVFQTGFITGTCTVQKVEVIDVTDEEEIVKELDLTGPYWFNDEDTGATCEMTAEGIAVTNPEVQESLWKPQMSILENIKLKKYHSYKVIVNAKIPSDGYLQVQLGTWGKECLKDIYYSVQASEDFQDLEFEYDNFPLYAEDGHVLFQNGGIAGTCIVKNVKVIDLDADLGDVNADGNVDKEDIIALAELILNGTYNANADINKDDKVNALDLVELIKSLNPIIYQTFNKYIWESGVNNNWGSIELPLYCANQDGIYTGFFYAQDADWSEGMGAFKFTGAFDSWDDGNYGTGSINDDGLSGTLINSYSSGNIIATPGFYKATVNLVGMTYSLTPIASIGIVGPAQSGGWSDDTNLTYNPATLAWEGTIELAADEFKFRANDSWEINWGGEVDNLSQNGNSLTVSEAGTYFIQFFPLCETKSYCILSKK